MSEEFEPIKEFLDALDSSIAERLVVDGKNLLLRLNKDFPHPETIRVHLDRIRHGGRKEYEYNIEPKPGEHFEEADSEATEFSSLNLLGGYYQEEDVFAFWDIDLYDRNSPWGTKYMDISTLEAAAEDGQAIQRRKLRQTRNGETVVAARSDQLLEAIRRRAIRQWVRDLLDQYFPEGWADQADGQRWIEDTMIQFLTNTDTTEPLLSRLDSAINAAADLGVANADRANAVDTDRNAEDIEEYIKDEVWESEDGLSALKESLEAIDAEWREAMDRAEESSNGVTSKEPPYEPSRRSPEDYDPWEPPTESVFSGDTPEITEDLHFPDSDGRTVIEQIYDALDSGKHVILTGPPGSGKTAIAKSISSQLVGPDGYRVTTATDDWTTFDTIGGYRPQQNNQLEFVPGVFLQCFLDQGSLEAKNEWLVIDELNRADIDQAFGSLYTALTGENITLPFDHHGEQVELIGDPLVVDDLRVTKTTFVIPDDWRVIATMNTRDKSSLYRMSFAFTRRFSFIPIPVPDKGEITPDLIREYVDCWDEVDVPGADSDLWPDDLTDEADDDPSDHFYQEVVELWKVVQDRRKVGPALIKDVLRQVLAEMRNGRELDFGYAFSAHLLPQLDGISNEELEGIDEHLQGRVDHFSSEPVKKVFDDLLSDG